MVVPVELVVPARLDVVQSVKQAAIVKLSSLLVTPIVNQSVSYIDERTDKQTVRHSACQFDARLERQIRKWPFP